MTHSWKMISCATAMLVLIGCASDPYRKTYDGPARSFDEVAIVRCAPFVTVKAVDGNDSHYIHAGSGNGYKDCEIEVLPGARALDVTFDAPGVLPGLGLIPALIAEGIAENAKKNTKAPDGTVRIPLNAEAGHVYRIKLQRARSDWNVWIEDVTRDEKTTVVENRRLRLEQKK